MYKCKICNKEYENRWSFLGHCSSHNRGDEYREKRKSKKPKKNNTHICRYCGKKFNKGVSLGGHSVNCLLNPNKNVLSPELGIMGNKVRWSQPDARKKHSNSIKEAIKRNPLAYSANNVCGRVKLRDYIDSYGNKTKLNGSWEYEVALWLEKNNIKWTNIIVEEFYYEWNGGIHRYFPDFYLPEIDKYIEVKGYERERDKYKWKSFPYDLIKIKLNEIKQIKNNSYKMAK